MIENNNIATPDLNNQEPVQVNPPPLNQAEIAKTNTVEHRRMALIFTSFILIAIVSLGVIFKLKAETVKNSKNNVEEPIMYKQTPPTKIKDENKDLSITELQKQGNSDDLSAIEEDLKNTDFSDLDKELTDIEKEIFTP